VAATVNETLLDRVVLEQVRLLRLARTAARHVLAALASLDGQLADLAGSLTPGRKVPAAFLTELRRTVADTYARAAASIERELTSIGFWQADATFRILVSSAPTELRTVFERPSAAQIVAAIAQPIQGRTLREWFDGLAANTYARLRDVVRLGAVEGLTVGRMVSRAREALGIDRRGAEAVVRTLANGVATSARQVTLQANDDLFQGVQWVSTLDSRTTPICQERDGNLYPIDSGPRPPAHINCRSTIVPVLKGARALGLPPTTRASMDGQVAEDVTYGEWLRRQSREVQDEVLGKKRAALFRASKLPLDRFIDDASGRYYTLDELQQRERAAWRRVFNE
jgi:SPP1 gp7 family putative phage head morphogenesis protein